MRSLRLVTVFFSLLFGHGSAPAQSNPGNPLDGLDRLKSFETRRASSSDANWKDGNGDARPIDPNGTLTLAELEGPGVIAHIWCTISHPVPEHPRLLTLRMFWDREEHPSVECPIGDFFVIGHGLNKSFVSIPVRVSSNGKGRNCYWPMPFRKSARITVTNESNARCGAFYYYIDWQKHPSIPEDSAYFHAMYRQEFPCVMGQNYLLADIGGRGHYVGTVQSVYHSSSGWYGEGDDFFFIDGEAEPSLRGTGTEDYFCDGWGFREQDGPFYGTPLWEGGNTGKRGTAYRFHLTDPIVFQKSLRAEIEHKGSQTFPDGTRSGFIERDDLMSSVAFWYQTEPHKPWPALPTGAERLPFQQSTLVVGYRSLDVARHSDHPILEQPIGGATDGKQLWFKPTDESGWLEIPFAVEKEITGDLILRMTHSWDYGNYRVLIDGKEAGHLNLLATQVTSAEDPLGRQTLAPGQHVLRFECTGKAPASKGWLLGFDALQVHIPVYWRAPEKDLRELQKP